MSSIFFWNLDNNAEPIVKPIPGMSACNEIEAGAVVALCKWLILCGTPPSSITVITPYKGHKTLIIRNLRIAKLLPTISYQHQRNFTAVPHQQTKWILDALMWQPWIHFKVMRMTSFCFLSSDVNLETDSSSFKIVSS